MSLRLSFLGCPVRFQPRARLGRPPSVPSAAPAPLTAPHVPADARGARRGADAPISLSLPADTIELLASPAEVPEVEAEARQLLAALAHALYTRMARCTPVSDPSEERARQGAASALKDAEVALSGLVGCLSAPPMRCLGGAGAASLAKAFAQHALLLGRPSALEPAAMLLSAWWVAASAP